MARRYDAVEHVDTAQHRLGDINGRTDTHEVTGRRIRHLRQQRIKYSMALVFRLANGQAPDCITVEANIG